MLRKCFWCLIQEAKIRFAMGRNTDEALRNIEELRKHKYMRRKRETRAIKCMKKEFQNSLSFYILLLASKLTINVK